MHWTVQLRWFIWTAAVAGVIVATVFLINYVQPRRGAQGASAYKNGKSAVVAPPSDDDPPPAEPTYVKVVRPRRGAIERVTVQPGSMQAFETVGLFAKASGFLKKQYVDIGDKVKAGQILAEVDVPELVKLLQRNAASVDLAKAHVDQMKTKIAIATADVDAAKAKEVEASANAKSASAWVQYYRAKLKRFTELAVEKNIEEKLVDEAKRQYEAAVETENAARAAITSAKANVVAHLARIDQAHADVAVARAEVKVAEAEYSKTEVQLQFATVPAPFDGIITDRTLDPGAYVRSPSEGGGTRPLLTIQRTDRMRVVVLVPDKEVPFADPGDLAFVEIDALPGEKIPAKISRIAQSEDLNTRQMHVEIDVPNPKGIIRQGMYGRVTIVLDKSSDHLSVPSACLMGKAEAGKGAVYVVRDGHLQRQAVKLGIDNGLRVEILQGLRDQDEVVYQPSTALAEGAEVTTTLIEESSAQSAALEK